jgi:hypothetical protein
MAADKSSLGAVLAGLIGGGTGIAAWVDLNVDVAENTQTIVAERQVSEIHREYIKDELVDIKKMLDRIDDKLEKEKSAN